MELEERQHCEAEDCKKCRTWQRVGESESMRGKLVKKITKTNSRSAYGEENKHVLLELCNEGTKRTEKRFWPFNNATFQLCYR